jgi:putative ATPase
MILHPLKKEDLKTILTRAVEDKNSGLKDQDMEILPQAMDFIIEISSGDARVALNNLEAAVNYARDSEKTPKVLDLESVEAALNRKALPYDKDGEEHYNIISAFHKSMRGSDVNATVYWLYRMLEAGEDPLFIARRMIRFASEDIGLADPNALQSALAAFDAWQKVGPPEAELALMQAAVYLASAPKSNALYLAEKAVRDEIKRSGPLPVPMHIRNAPTGLMKKLGYSRGYLYPHNYPGAWVEQEYLPDNIKNCVYYTPSERGSEKEIGRRMEKTTKNRKKRPDLSHP